MVPGIDSPVPSDYPEWSGLGSGKTGRLWEVKEGFLGKGPRASKVRLDGYTEVSLARQTGEPLGRGKSLCKGLEVKARNYWKEAKSAKTRAVDGR